MFGGSWLDSVAVIGSKEAHVIAITGGAVVRHGSDLVTGEMAGAGDSATIFRPAKGAAKIPVSVLHCRIHIFKRGSNGYCRRSVAGMIEAAHSEVINSSVVAGVAFPFLQGLGHVHDVDLVVVLFCRGRTGGRG